MRTDKPLSYRAMAKVHGSRLLVLCAVAAAQLVAPTVLAQTEENTGIQISAQEKDAASLEGQLLVKFSDSLTVAEIDEINKRLGATVLDRMSDGRLLLVEIPYPNVRQQIIDAYTATEGVIYAEPNQAVSIPPSPEKDCNSASDGEGRSSAPTIGLPQVSD